MFAWMLPISESSRRKGSDRMHLLPVSARTDELLPAFCGKPVNPGFALFDASMPKCSRCERKLRGTNTAVRRK